MGNFHVGKFYEYLDKRHDAGLDAGLYAALTPCGHGGSKAHADRAVYVAMLYDVQVKPDKQGRMDRGVWTTKTKLAARSGYSEVSDSLSRLVQHGYIFEWRSPRQQAKTAGYMVVDVEAEAAALDAWRSAFITARTAAAAGADDLLLPGEASPAAVAEADAKIKDARAGFTTKFPGHYPTNGRILAILEGRQPVVGTPRAQAVDDKRRVKAEMAAYLAARGVADPTAAVARFLDDRAARGEYTTTKALRRVLEAGGLDAVAVAAGQGAPVSTGPGPEPAPAPVAVALAPAAVAVVPSPRPVVSAPAIAPALRPLSDRDRHELRAAARRRFGSVVADLRAAGVGADDAADAVADAVAGFTAAWQAAHGAAPTDIQLDLAMGGLGPWVTTPGAAVPALDGVQVPIPAALERAFPAAA